MFAREVSYSILQRYYPSRGIGLRHFVDRLDRVEYAEVCEGDYPSTLMPTGQCEAQAHFGQLPLSFQY